MRCWRAVPDEADVRVRSHGLLGSPAALPRRYRWSCDSAMRADRPSRSGPIRRPSPPRASDPARQGARFGSFLRSRRAGRRRLNEPSDTRSCVSGCLSSRQSPTRFSPELRRLSRSSTLFERHRDESRASSQRSRLHTTLRRCPRDDNAHGWDVSDYAEPRQLLVPEHGLVDVVVVLRPTGTRGRCSATS
jgi:hypothetical protein